MRWFPLSIPVVVLILVHFVPDGALTASQDKSNDAFAPQMLAEHNEWRKKYKVPPVVWDEALATDAQNFANQVAANAKFPPAHRRNTANGENFFWGTAGGWDVKDAVGRWESESKNYDLATNTCAPGKTCVHFTQLVWSTTTKVGCGKATTANRETDFFVCVYYPGGNTEGLGPFSVMPRNPAKVTDPAAKPAPASAEPATSTRPTARRAS